MQFEVNGQTYFLNFAPEEREWYLLTSTQDGFKDVEIASDAPPPTGAVLLPVDEKQKTTIN